MTPRYADFRWTSEDRLCVLAAGDAPWQYYLETAVRIEAPDVVGTVSPVADPTGETQPPLGPLHVITAIQPDSDLSSIENSVRMSLLDNELSAAGLTLASAVGSSFDGMHSESSRAVFGLDDAAARRLGTRFGQVAVFAWSGPIWSLLACTTDRRTDQSWRWVVNSLDGVNNAIPNSEGGRAPGQA